MVCFAFEDLDSFDVIRAVYKYGFDVPSPVQQYAIPKLLQGQSISVNAQTGSGKTAAFGISLLSLLSAQKALCQGVIVSPTKELSIQTFEVISALGGCSGIKGVNLTSGTLAKEQFESISRGHAHFVCVTPKRLAGLCAAIQLGKLRIVILDECDKLLEEKTYHSVASFLQGLPPGTIVGCFSATATEPYRRAIKGLCPRAEHTSIDPVCTERNAIRHVCIRIFDYTQADVEKALARRDRSTKGGNEKDENSDDWLEPHVKQRSKRKSYSLAKLAEEEPEDAASKEEVCAEKVRVLVDLLETVPIVQGIVFCNSKYTVDWLCDTLRRYKHPCDKVHADVPINARENAISSFRAGKTRLLIASDLLSRGFDVQQVTFVCNFDFPREAHTYMHRAGRCGRFGRKGLCVSLLTAESHRHMEDVEQRYRVQMETA